ncbi:MAG: phosphate transporter permease [Frankiales bacterium]|nr:phosphate transporter permease [Frankiales bacterium]
MSAVPVLELDGRPLPVRVLLRDLVRARGLLLMLARQDFAARYRSAVLGLAWTVLLPLLQGAVLALVFTKVVRVPSTGHYAGFVLVGMATWGYLNGALGAASTSIVDGGSLATKVYFPRLVLPAVAPTSGLVGYGLSLLVAVAVGLGQAREAHWQLVLLPAAMALAFLLVTSLSAVTALLHVWFRDVRYLVTALLLIAFYATPVIYPLSITHGLKPLVIANPATGVVQLTRWCVFGQADSVGLSVAVTAGWTLLFCGLAAVLYARHERTACDRL